MAQYVRGMQLHRIVNASDQCFDALVLPVFVMVCLPMVASLAACSLVGTGYH